jgi:flagellar biosynthesis protein FlhF
MIIKRYIVDNMNEAMVKIRYELGNDAVIVSQKKIKQKGLTGYFRHKKLEVTAAVDDKPKKANEVVEKKPEFQNEIAELKTMVQELINQKESSVPKKEPKASKSKQKLIDNDIPEEIIDDLYNRIKENYPDKKENAKVGEKELQAVIADMIKISSNGDGKIHMLVGPTGVGKTTTIAKLASMYTLYKNKKIGLITIDTYRIGAVEQLKTYAEILGVPFGVVLSSKDIPDVMNKMQECEIVLIDTTGRNSKNIMQLSEIKKFAQEIKADRIHLVLSMTTKVKDIKRITNEYRITNYNNVILTKIDETDTFGSLLASLYYANVPVAYLTNGQNVPEDIEEASSEKMLKLIIGDNK